MVRLKDLKPGQNSFLFLERYVNDGSPSGFSFLNTPKPGFRPSDAVKHFQLPIFECTNAAGATNVGSIPTLAPGELPVHPDMSEMFTELLGRPPHRHLQATATSSGRTLSAIDNGVSFYVKLAYQGLLGRVTRKMTRAHVLSAIEVSSAYEVAINSGQMPSTFHIYREHFGLYFPDSSPLKDWGYIERSIAPYPEGQFIEMPAFSLIAEARQTEKPLLMELLEAVPILRSEEAFFTHLIQPLLDLYLSSVLVTGLQPEAHSQNVVFLLNEDFLPIGVALRDMESVDKDVPLIESKGLSDCFSPTAYKFLSKDAYNYQIMHSFMYDFKLGEYLLAPLVDAWAENVGQQALKRLEERIKAYVCVALNSLPDDFFPKNVWYDYAPMVHEGTSTRKYREHLNPRFR